MSYEVEGQPSLKVILVGSSGVGKTSLVSSFFDNPFEKQELPTVAPASCSATIKLENDQKVELQIWDTAGQERFQAISKMFYRDSHVAFICYDSTTTDSVEQWVQRVKAEVPSCILFLVTTKADLITSQDEMDQCIEFGKELSDKYGFKQHIITSASTGSGVKELFTLAAKHYTDVNKPSKEQVNLNQTKPPEKKNCC